MEQHQCSPLVFRGTSPVYGEPEVFPLHEQMPTVPVHPYAQTKLAVEQMLGALCSSGYWRVACLRYFNPVGAHPSGRIGEDPLGIPNDLFPFITQVASGRRDKLRIFGQDYPTHDGTGIRDYLHVMDLAEVHSVTLGHLFQATAPNKLTLDIGMGSGLSVLEVVKGFEQATRLPIPYEFVERRPGDVPKLEGCSQISKDILGCSAQHGLAQICRNGWAWQQTKLMRCSSF